MGQDAPMRIWVVGQYGCLASWIGHTLGSARNSRFIDGEETMADLSGRSMTELARTDKGERHDWASCYVRYVTTETGNVVASVPACVADDHDDTQLLVHSGTLVYLRLSRDTLATYATSDPRQHRSAAQVQGWLNRVFDRRDQALARAAHHVVDVVSGSGTDARAATTMVNRRLRQGAPEEARCRRVSSSV